MQQSGLLSKIQSAPHNYTVPYSTIKVKPYNSQFTGNILYSGKLWQEKTLANLANCQSFLPQIYDNLISICDY